MFQIVKKIESIDTFNFFKTFEIIYVANEYKKIGMIYDLAKTKLSYLE